MGCYVFFGKIWTQTAEADLRRKYGPDSPVKRRELLFPFLWGTVVKSGQLFGNASRRDTLIRADSSSTRS